MRLIFAVVFACFLAISFTTFNSCGSKAENFCDTACNSDTLRFTAQHPDNPFVAIGFRDCKPDTITWSHSKLPAKRKLIFSDLTGKEVHINKSHFRHYIKDTSYAWLIFNDCISGQGYIVKIPFNKTGTIQRKNSAFNSLDPRFKVADNLVAYTDKGNMFIEDITTGKKATMTFGKQIDMDYNNIHDKVDSVTVTPTYARARIKIDNEWTVIEDAIELK